MEEYLERIGEALDRLEAMTAQWNEREVNLRAEAEERIERIVATVAHVGEQEMAARLQAAEAKLAEAEERIAELCAQAAAGEASAGRKTAAAGVVKTLAKQGISASALDGLQTGGRMEAGSLDTALASLSIEQRFAVKAEMLRSGLLG